MNELEKAIEMLKAEYERALNLEYVKMPLAWALYHTWKNVEARKVLKERKEKEVCSNGVR